MSSRLKRVVDISGAWDWQWDPWGTSMSLFFDVAAVLDATDIAGDATPGPFTRWEYQRPPFTTVPSVETIADEREQYSYGERELARAYIHGEITQGDLIHAGNVLDRYTGLLRAAGKDY